MHGAPCSLEDDQLKDGSGKHGSNKKLLDTFLERSVCRWLSGLAAFAAEEWQLLVPRPRLQPFILMRTYNVTLEHLGVPEGSPTLSSKAGKIKVSSSEVVHGLPSSMHCVHCV